MAKKSISRVSAKEKNWWHITVRAVTNLRKAMIDPNLTEDERQELRFTVAATGLFLPRV